MGFDRFLLPEQFRQIADNVRSPMAFVVRYDEGDLTALAELAGGLVATPVSVTWTKVPLDGSVFERAGGNLDESFRTEEVHVLEGAAGETLVGLFAVMGVALRCERKVEIVYGGVSSDWAFDSGEVAGGEVNEATLKSFEEKIADGAEIIFGGARAHVGNPRSMAMYAFVKPLAYH